MIFLEIKSLCTAEQTVIFTTFIQALEYDRELAREFQSRFYSKSAIALQSLLLKELLLKNCVEDFANGT